MYRGLHGPQSHAMYAHARTGHIPNAAPRCSIVRVQAWEVVTLINFAVADTSVLVTALKNAAG